jgi:hypothetical protein
MSLFYMIVLGLVGFLFWLLIGGYFLGKAQALETFWQQERNAGIRDDKHHYSHDWNEYEFCACLFWPILAVNVFAWESRQYSMDALRSERDKQAQLLEQAQKAKAERESIEQELAL